jgi:hypothetical protein
MMYVARKPDHKVSNDEMIEKIVQRVEAQAAALRAATDQGCGITIRRAGRMCGNMPVVWGLLPCAAGCVHAAGPQHRQRNIEKQDPPRRRFWRPSRTIRRSLRRKTGRPAAFPAETGVRTGKSTGRCRRS